MEYGWNWLRTILLTVVRFPVLLTALIRQSIGYIEKRMGHFHSSQMSVISSNDTDIVTTVVGKVKGKVVPVL
jgi:hypothetical protein